MVCFDAKLNFDDNAEFRQKKVFEEQDLSETDPREVRAIKLGLNYIQMDGNIGCLVKEKKHLIWIVKSYCQVWIILFHFINGLLVGERCWSGYGHHGHHFSQWRIAS